MKLAGSGMLRRGLFINFLALFLVSAFSTDGLAYICDNVDTSSSEDESRAYIAENPNDPFRYYMVGLSSYCGGNAKGISYIERASDMELVVASYVLGIYYRTDKGSNPDQRMPKVQGNYDAAIFYYERTAENIDSTDNYPYYDVDISGIEGKQYISIRTDLRLSYLYYKGYVRAIQDMIKNDEIYTDTIKVLENMRNSSERCLNRPSLSAWGNRQSEIAHSKQVVCQARRDFANTAISLEAQRIEVAKQCKVLLKECNEHKDIVNQLVQASEEMGSRIRSVPKI